MRSLQRWSARGALAAALVVLLAGCASPATTPPTSAPLGVTNTWVRPTTGGDQPTAAYLTIVNAGTSDERLLSASSPDAASVEIHRTMTDASGMTGMTSADGLVIPAGTSVAFYPGGMHLMVMGLSHPLKVGDTLRLQLVFERAGSMPVVAEVRQD